MVVWLGTISECSLGRGGRLGTGYAIWRPPPPPSSFISGLGGGGGRTRHLAGERERLESAEERRERQEEHIRGGRNHNQHGFNTLGGGGGEAWNGNGVPLSLSPVAWNNTVHTRSRGSIVVRGIIHTFCITTTHSGRAAVSLCNLREFIEGPPIPSRVLPYSRARTINEGTGSRANGADRGMRKYVRGENMWFPTNKRASLDTFKFEFELFFLAENDLGFLWVL